jgi:hypothetical protein
MVIRDSLEKCRRAQAREGLPLEASPSTEEEEEDDDDEGMEVRVGFSPKVGPRSVPALVSPSSDTAPSAQGSAASLSGPRASAELAPVPASVEEVEVVEGEVTPLPEEVVVATAGAPVESPQRLPAGGNMEEGPLTPPMSSSRGP